MESSLPPPLVHPGTVRRLGKTVLLYAIISSIGLAFSIFGLLFSFLGPETARTFGIFEQISLLISFGLNLAMVVTLFRWVGRCNEYVDRPIPVKMLAMLVQLNLYYLLVLVAFGVSILSYVSMLF